MTLLGMVLGMISKKGDSFGRLVFCYLSKFTRFKVDPGKGLEHRPDDPKTAKNR